jgi:hypothetical protein
MWRTPLSIEPPSVRNFYFRLTAGRGAVSLKVAINVATSHVGIRAPAVGWRKRVVLPMRFFFAGALAVSSGKFQAVTGVADAT